MLYSSTPVNKEVQIEMDAEGSAEENKDNVDEDEEESSEDSFEVSGNDNWFYMPDSILLSIFRYLNPKELLTAGEVCKSWNRVSKDEFLWKDLLYHTFKIDPSIGIVPGKLIKIRHNLNTFLAHITYINQFELLTFIIVVYSPFFM